MQFATYCGCLVNNRIWMSNMLGNGLYSFDFDSLQLKCEETFVSSDLFATYLHKKVIYHENRMFFIPLLDDSVIVYDIRTHAMREIKVKDDKKESFVDAFIIDNALWLIPMYMRQKLIIIDLETLTVNISSYFTNECIKLIGFTESILAARCEYYDNKIEFAVYGTNKIIQWDLKKNIISASSIVVDDLFMIRIIDGKKWFVSNSSADIYYEENGDYFKVSSPYEKEGKKRLYNGIEKINNEIIILPAFCNKIFRVNNIYMEEIFDFDREEKETVNSQMPSSFGVVNSENLCILLPFHYKSIFVIQNSDTISEITICDDFTIEKKHIKQLGILEESDDFRLELFLNSIL